MKRVLVTGATGCIGRHALGSLGAAGWDVHAVSSRPQSTASGVTWHTVDLLDGSQVKAVVSGVSATHLLHLAWYVEPGRWATSPANLDWVAASLTLVRAFRDSGGQRVVTAGSCLEYDWNYGYCSENRTPCTPHTLYGVCKHAVQLLTSALADGDAFTSAWPRIFFLFGPWEHPNRLVASVIRSILNGQPALCSDGRQIRDYLFAQDVADAIVALLDSKVTGPVNIGSGQPIALKDIVQRVGDMLSRPDLVRLGAIPQASTDVPLVVADVSRLRNEVGWTPRFSLDQGLRRTIEWWRAHLDSPVTAGRPA